MYIESYTLIITCTSLSQETVTEINFILDHKESIGKIHKVELLQQHFLNIIQ